MLGGMKTLLPLSLLSLAVAYPLVLAADIVGIKLPESCDALNLVTLYLGIGLSLIILHSYEEKPVDRPLARKSERAPASVQVLRTRHS
jgi:hypothetical protein